MKPTGWKTSLPEETSQDAFKDRIYHHDAKATSFDFPWFIRVGAGYFQKAVNYSIY